MFFFNLSGIRKLNPKNKGKTEIIPLEDTPQKEEIKAFEAYLLKKGMELIKSYPIILKVS
jgi:hypothetical protein